MFTTQLPQIFIPQNFRIAFDEISSNASGIDEVSYKEFSKIFKANIDELITSLQKGTYIPEPLKKIEIPKEGSDELRPIALSSIKDKLVQKVLYKAINPYFDEQFSNKSYAYRSGKSTLNAINRASQFLHDGNYFILKTDIDNFFETINHDKLLLTLDKQISDKSITRRYFGHYFSQFERKLTKGYRSKNPPLDPVNAVLSFIYTLAYHQITAKLYMRGFDPSISYLHTPFRSHFALSSDIMEPLRAHINNFVAKLFLNKTLTTDDFTLKGGVYLKYESRRDLWKILKPYMDTLNKKLNKHIIILKKEIVKKDYLICYDISDETVDDIKGINRLSKVAKYLEKVSFRIQYSIFLVPKATKSEIDNIIKNLKELISKDKDDVRIYTIKNHGHHCGIATDINEPFIIA